MIEKPRFDLYVPREYAVLSRAIAPLPQPFRGAILRLVGAEKVTATPTRADRAAYEERMRGLTGNSGS